MFDGCYPPKVVDEPRTAAEAVENGYRFLLRFPGAIDRINPATLRIASEEDCALGQVYGSYDAALQALDLPADVKPSDYGFDASPFFSLSDLDVAWRAKLALH